MNNNKNNFPYTKHYKASMKKRQYNLHENYVINPIKTLFLLAALQYQMSDSN